MAVSASISHVRSNPSDALSGPHCCWHAQAHSLSICEPIIPVIMATIKTDPRISSLQDDHELEKKRGRDSRRANLAEEDKGLVYWQVKGC